MILLFHFILAKINGNIYDESFIVPKPLIVAVRELGEVSERTVQVLQEFGAEDPNKYDGQCTIIFMSQVPILALSISEFLTVSDPDSLKTV